PAAGDGTSTETGTTIHPGGKAPGALEASSAGRSPVAARIPGRTKTFPADRPVIFPASPQIGNSAPRMDGPFATAGSLRPNGRWFEELHAGQQQVARPL